MNAKNIKFLTNSFVYQSVAFGFVYENPRKTPWSIEDKICSGIGVSRGLSAVNAVSKYLVSKVCSKAGLKGGSSCLLSSRSQGKDYARRFICYVIKANLCEFAKLISQIKSLLTFNINLNLIIKYLPERKDVLQFREQAASFQNLFLAKWPACLLILDSSIVVWKVFHCRCSKIIHLRRNQKMAIGLLAFHITKPRMTTNLQLDCTSILL